MEQQAVAAKGRNPYYEGQFGAEEPEDTAARLALVAERDELRGKVAAWTESAMQMARNADFYRGLLDQCAEHLGREAYTADDGTVMGTPVRLKIPELVAELVRRTDACQKN